MKHFIISAMALMLMGATSPSAAHQDHKNHDEQTNYSLMIDLAYGKGSCLLYTSPSPRDLSTSRMPSSA